MSLSETVSAAGLAVYAEAALVLFFIVFLSVVIQVTRKWTAEAFRHESRLPLDECERNDQQGRATARETPEAIHHGR
jgi:hypothetical protein